MGRREQPLADGPLQEFAQGLRDLRSAAGLTYRALERRAGFSASALSAAAGGQRLPSLEVTCAYVGACGGKAEEWEARWRALSATLRAKDPAPADARQQPGTVAPAEVDDPAQAGNPGRGTVGPGSRRLLRPRLGLALLLIAAIAGAGVLLATRTPAARHPQTARLVPGTAPIAGSQSPSGGPGNDRPKPPTVPPNGSAAPGNATAAPSGPAVAPAPAMPGPGPAAVVAVARTDGPGCGAMTRNGAWVKLDGSAQAGCGDGYLHEQTGDQSAADWVFTPGAGKHCTFTIYIANSSSVTATSAEYQLFDATVHSRLLSRQDLDQAAHRGGTLALTALETITGTYDLQLYDFTGQDSAEYAGAVTLICT